MKPQNKGPKPATSFDDVYQYAIWWLSQREHSETEIASKLHRKTTNEQWIAEVMAKLLENRYVDDQRYCEIWVRSHAHRYSTREMAQKLTQKGIDSTLIQTTIEQEQTPTHQMELGQRIVQKHQAKAGKQKLIQLLRQAQLPSEIIETLLQEKDENTEESDAQKALRLLNGKQKTPIDPADRKQKDKLMRFLISRGFSFDHVNFAFRYHLQDPDDLEEFE